MTAPVITFCRTCEGADPAMQAHLRAALTQAGLAAEICGVDCMSGCTRAPTLAVRQDGKTAYLFGEIGQGDIPDLVRFMDLYGKSETGDLADARPIGGLRFKAIARIPGAKSH